MDTNLFHWPIRVYYEDTDAGGVVYHARYVAFYERARTEMLRQRHFSQELLLKENIAFAVRQMNVEYLSPARLDDLLTVTTELVALRGASLTFSQQITNEQGKLLSRANVLIACIDITKMKPIALPKTIVAEFS